MAGPYRIDNAEVRDAVTGELNQGLVGEQIQIVTRDTTTPYPIQDAATDPIPDSLLTVQASMCVPTFYIVTATPADLYLDWYHAGSGARGPVNFERVLRDEAVAARVAAEAAADSADASADAAQVAVAALQENLVVRVVHRDDADFPRPVWLGPVDWVGTVNPNNAESTDFLYTADPTVGGDFVGAMDPFTFPWRAYSLRRLLSLYTGPLVRVRRSSDDTTLDIGFDVDGDLDTTALLAFVGAGDCFVTRWYDQTGGGANLEQGTTTAQPSIVTAGAVNTLDSLPAVTFDGTTDYLTVASVGLYAAGAATMALVFSGASASNATVVSESNNAGGGALYRLLRSSTAAWNVQATNNTGSLWANSAAGDTSFDAAQHQMFYADSGSQINTHRDGAPKHVAFAATRSGVMTLSNLNLGAHLNGGVAANFLTGKVQELVLWNSNQSVDRVAISDAQKAHWGTP
jgi:hypothetical protein